MKNFVFTLGLSAFFCSTPSQDFGFSILGAWSLRGCGHELKNMLFLHLGPKGVPALQEKKKRRIGAQIDLVSSRRRLFRSKSGFFTNLTPNECKHCNIAFLVPHTVCAVGPRRQRQVRVRLRRKGATSCANSTGFVLEHIAPTSSVNICREHMTRHFVAHHVCQEEHCTASDETSSQSGSQVGTS